VAKRALQKVHPLNVFLLKEEIAAPDDALSEDESTTRVKIAALNSCDAVLIIRSPRSNPPSWASFFLGHVEASRFGRVSSTAAVLILKVSNRWFALTFGYGAGLLRDEVVEERFGIRVCVNCIDPSSIRSIDKKSFDALQTQSRVQTSRAASIGNFGLDVEQDLLKATTGKPKDEALGERMTGMDALSVGVRANLLALPPLLEKYEAASRSTRYRKDFPWIDNLAEVKSDAKIAELDHEMAVNLRERDHTRCWIAVPDIVDWTRIGGFRYSRRHKAPLHYDLHLGDWLDTLKDDTPITAELLRHQPVFASDEEGIDFDQWSLYRCLYCEVADGKNSYFLTGGKWFRVHRDLVSEVDTAYSALPRLGTQLPEYDHASERKYNEAVVAALPKKYAFADSKLVPVGAAGRIEVCDLFGRAGEFFHVKRYGASSVLSHLFGQALVSSEAMRADLDVRKGFAKLLPREFGFDATRFDASKCTVVLAVVSDRPGDLVIPFFSRLNLKHVSRRIRAFGYELAIAKIEVAARRRALKKFMSK
jgi:uncharacterized protein (TIGR04141 family)